MMISSLFSAFCPRFVRGSLKCAIVENVICAAVQNLPGKALRDSSRFAHKSSRESTWYIEY